MKNFTLFLLSFLSISLFSQEIIQYNSNHIDTLDVNFENNHFLQNNSQNYQNQKSTFPYLNSYYYFGSNEYSAFDWGFNTLQIDSFYYISGRTRIGAGSTFANEIAFAMKVDLEGNKIWQRKDSVTDNDHWNNSRGPGLIELSNGNLLYVFHYQQNYLSDSAYYRRPVCIKFEKSGNVLDTFIWQDSIDFLSSGLIAEDDGGFTLFGRQGSKTLVWNPSSAYPNGGIFEPDTHYLGVIRVDSNMNIIKRAKHFPFHFKWNNFVNDIVRGENSSYLIGGKLSTNYSVNGAAASSYYILKLDSNFNMMWYKQLKDSVEEFYNPINLVKSKYGGYYYTKVHPTKGIAYGKFNENGDTLWEKYFQKQMDPSDSAWSIIDRPHGIIEKDNGDIIFGTRINFYAYAGLVRADSLGNIKWARMLPSLGKNGEIWPILIEKIENPIGEGAIIVGTTHGKGASLIRTDSMGCSMPNCMDTLWGVGFEDIQKLTQKALMLYPNPTKDILNFALNSKNEQIKNCKIMDINGREIISKEVNNIHSKIDISAFSRGIYIIEITTDNENIVREKFVKE